MNQWLKRKLNREYTHQWYFGDEWVGTWHNKEVVFPYGTTLKSLKSRLTVNFWAVSERGEREFFQSFYPFEEVITHHCSERTVIGGFSIWLDGMTEVMWQSFGSSGYDVPPGANVEITTNSLYLS